MALTPGTELPIVTNLLPSGYSPESIQTLADGSYIITWSAGTRPTWDVYGQRFSAEGVAIGDEFLVNTTLADTQQESEIIALPDGGFVIVWVGAGMVEGVNLPGIFAQRYNAEGARVGVETRLVEAGITAKAFTATQVQADTLSDGGYVLSWTLHYNTGFLHDVVMVQTFDADGTARAPAVATDPTITEGQYWFSSVAALTGGGFVVTWTQNVQDFANNVYAQRYDASGNAIGAKVQVNTFSPGWQENSAVTALSDGGYVITWSSSSQLDIYADVYAQRYDSNGVAVGGETLINTYTATTQFQVKVTGLSDGGYVIVWISDAQDGNAYGCYGQQFDAAGNRVGAEFLINTSTQGSQYAPLVTALRDGGFAVTWISYVTGQPAEMFHRVFAAGPTIEGTENADILTGTAGQDVLNGLGGNDSLDGGADADTMNGGLGNDTYYVDNAGDTVIELKKQGTDTVNASVSFSIAATHVENLTLTGTDAINATGNALNNILVSNKGVNVLTGGLGDDTYFVHNNTDTVVELKKEGTDTVNAWVSFSIATTHVENLKLLGTGHIHATGNALNNVLTGNAGNNFLTGGLGDDTYVVQNIGDIVVERRDEGTDTVMASVDYSIAAQFVENLTLTGTGDLSATGNNFRNTLIGNDGNNRLDGGLNKDILTGGLGADLFVFGLNSGKDVITDFDAAENDAIDISAYTMGLANAGMVYQFGLDTVINLPGDNRIIVSNASQADVLGQIIW